MTANETTEAMSRVGTLARAVVHAGGVETRYVRAGAGPVVVLLAPQLEHEDVLTTVQKLSGEFLVIAAAPPRDTTPLADWLHEFLDCLGMSGAHVLLHASGTAFLTGEHIDA